MQKQNKITLHLIKKNRKKIKAIKDKILRNVKNLFDSEKEEESYYKPVRVSNFWGNMNHD